MICGQAAELSAGAENFCCSQTPDFCWLESLNPDSKVAGRQLRNLPRLARPIIRFRQEQICSSLKRRGSTLKRRSAGIRSAGLGPEGKL
jgi:hypothetical protein